MTTVEMASTVQLPAGPALEVGMVVMATHNGLPFSGVVKTVRTVGRDVRVGVSLNPLGGDWPERVVHLSPQELQVCHMPELAVGQRWTYQGGGVFEVLAVLSRIAAVLRKVDTGVVLNTVILTRPWVLAPAP